MLPIFNGAKVGIPDKAGPICKSDIFVSPIFYLIGLYLLFLLYIPYKMYYIFVENDAGF